METLEVEIGYIQQLMDDEVSRVLQASILFAP